MKIRLTTLATLLLTSFSPAKAENLDWDRVLEKAKGTTVYWNAWGGSPQINDFIEWVGDEALAQYGVTLNHVKLSDTADAVTTVLSEKGAGNSDKGSIDLIWINGENFRSMKENGLLYGPFAEALPNWAYVDVEGKPAVITDFTVSTEGFESPWAMAQLVFEYDMARLDTPPKSLAELKTFLANNPGRFTFPQPPDYLGTTFLKQALYGLIEDPAVLQNPVEEAQYDQVTAPLWAFLDEITPNLWRKGRAFPQNETALGQLLADGEIDISFAFNPGRASAAIANGELPDTVRSFVFKDGTIGNASFVAIPFNAAHKEGAMVIANLLLDPKVQLQAQNPEILGFQTVLDVDALGESEQEAFKNLPLGVATLSPTGLGQSLLEPHSSWMSRIAEDWIERYGVSG